MNEKTLRKEIAVEAKVLDSGSGIVEYVASDESIDSYGEVIRASGWRFDRFAKNAPFVDSHSYYNIADLLGKVVDFRVDGKRLVETVQWAIDVPSNSKARIGWDMTRAGYLKAVSVGFVPRRMVSKWDSDKAGWMAQLKDLGLHEEQGVRAIYIEQEQIELSAVIIPANPNALMQVAKAYKAGCITEADLLALSRSCVGNHSPSNPTTDNASSASDPGPADDTAKARARAAFVERIQQLIK